MKGSCPICGEFKANLWDHLTRIHHMEGTSRRNWMDSAKLQNQSKFREIRPTKDDNCESFYLKHPFTCMVSGMTGCGKTSWVKRLLENKGKTIQPLPQRIVWCYSRWQPAYADMIQSIPEIEFVRGIPPDIENDDYFDVKIRNLIVIDDQMSSASNDKKVINLFTQGSHHRNLSVIYLVQNLFHQGKGNRDISLNCHYLVIFKNPRDQLQITTLAKQMYPRKTSAFLQKYEEAVSRPFGYLFIDLKTTTPDHCRLRTNVLPGENEQEDESKDLVKELSRFLQQKTTTQSPIKTKLQSLREKMMDVLKDPNLSKDQKVRQYTQLQTMFLQYKKKLESSLSFPVQALEADEHNISFGGIPADPNETYNQDEALFPTPQANNPIDPLSNLGPIPAEFLPLPSSPFPEEQSETPLNVGRSEELFSPGISSILTPPPTVFPEKKAKKAQYKMKNYLDGDSHKTYGPYAPPTRYRRSKRINSFQI